MSDTNPEKDLKVTKVFNQKTIKKGIAYFLSFSVISLVAIFLYTNTGKTLEVWKQINPLFLLLTFALVGGDMFLGALRNHIFVKEFKKGGSIWISFKANLANIFMGAVTPSQSGGGIAQFYIFHKNGVKLPDAITLSFINWISTLIFFPIAGIISYFIIKDNIPSGFISYLAQFGFSVFTILISVVLVALFFPQLVGNLIIKIGGLFKNMSTKWENRLKSFGEKAKKSMIDYRSKCVNLLKRKPQLMLYSFVITIILYLNKFILAYIIVLALGAKADIAVILAIQAIIYLLLYFAPSPGGSGIAELSIAGLMAGILPDDYIGTFTFLQRSLLVFIPAMIGAFVVLKELNKKDDVEGE